MACRTVPYGYYWPAQNSENVVVNHIHLFTLSIFANVEECLIMISPKHSITATIEGNVVDIR